MLDTVTMTVNGTVEYIDVAWGYHNHRNIKTLTTCDSCIDANLGVHSNLVGWSDKWSKGFSNTNWEYFWDFYGESRIDVKLETVISQQIVTDSDQALTMINKTVVLEFTADVDSTTEEVKIQNVSVHYANY